MKTKVGKEAQYIGEMWPSLLALKMEDGEEGSQIGDGLQQTAITTAQICTPELKDNKMF